MIQPLKSAQRSSWLVYWLDIDEPVPTGSDYMLPTLFLVTDQRGVPLAPPELMEELDQFRVEQFLGALIDRIGTPETILVGESEEWDSQAWRDFAEDYKTAVEFTRFAGRDSLEMQTISQHVVQQFASSAETAPNLALGLVATALRVRSESKKMALLKKALASDSECAEARIELADADFRRSDWKQALHSYDELIVRERQRWAPQRTDWWSLPATRPYLRAIYGRAMTLWHQGRYPGAAETLADLLELNPRDHQGARFLVPLVHLLSDDYEAAEAAYEAYARNYPRDYSEPSFLFGWGLLHAYFGRDAESVNRYQQGILKNFYIPPLLLDVPGPPEMLWHPSDRSEAGYAREFMDSYSMLWDRMPAARRNLREAWDGITDKVREMVHLRQRMLDFQDQRYEPDYKKLWQELVAADERISSPTQPEP